MGMAVSCHSYILPLLPCMEGLLAWPRSEGAGPITDPGGREAGIRALTGASTILMLLRRILRLYLQYTQSVWGGERGHTYLEYRQQIVMVATKAATPMKTAMMRIRIWIQSTLGAVLT